MRCCAPSQPRRSLELRLCAKGMEEHADTRNLHVSADRQRLRQVLLNLFGNAVKYNVHGGSVTVSYQLTPERLRLRVADTGPGISPDKHARLFIPFDRLGAEGNGRAGHGAGPGAVP